VAYCGNRKLSVPYLSVGNKRLRLVYSVKKGRRQNRRPPALDSAGSLIRLLVRSGATLFFERRAEENREELRLRDTQIKTMLWTCKVIRQDPGPAYESSEYTVTGQMEEQKENRRIHREFAISVVVEVPQKPGFLRIVRIRQLREIGV
jgi:hypothetical protein